MVFCNIGLEYVILGYIIVTILILIDGFLQLKKKPQQSNCMGRHNPYFNRWFSAIWCLND